MSSKLKGSGIWKNWTRAAFLYRLAQPVATVKPGGKVSFWDSASSTSSSAPLRFDRIVSSWMCSRRNFSMQFATSPQTNVCIEKTCVAQGNCIDKRWDMLATHSHPLNQSKDFPAVTAGNCSSAFAVAPTLVFCYTTLYKHIQYYHNYC